MEKHYIQQKKDLLGAMRRQLDISKQMNANLVEESKELENTIEDMYHKLKPVTSMNNAVAVCKGNMHAAMECI